MMNAFAASMLIFLALQGFSHVSRASASDAASSGFKEIPSAKEKETPLVKEKKEPPAEKKEVESESSQKSISAVVRIIRSNPETEVFFKDYKDSLIIPRNSRHNSIYEACEQSRQKGTAVKLIVDPKGRQILSLPDSKPKAIEETAEKSQDSVQ